MRHVFDGSAKQINASSYTKVASISTCRRPKCQRIAGSSAVSHVYPGGKKFAKVDDFDNLISPREVYLDFLRDR